MLKVEEELVAAMRMWKPFNKGNTSLEIVKDSQGNNMYCLVKLFGNHIATWDANKLNITMAGWNTLTTKSRLNALLEEFNEPLGHSMNIRTHKGQTYLCDYTTNTQYEMDSDDIYSIGYEVTTVKYLTDF